MEKLRLRTGNMELKVEGSAELIRGEREAFYRHVNEITEKKAGVLQDVRDSFLQTVENTVREAIAEVVEENKEEFKEEIKRQLGKRKWKESVAQTFVQLVMDEAKSEWKMPVSITLEKPKEY